MAERLFDELPLKINLGCVLQEGHAFGKDAVIQRCFLGWSWPRVSPRPIVGPAKEEAVINRTTDLIVVPVQTVNAFFETTLLSYKETIKDEVQQVIEG
jgi:hypothetical protein